MGLASTLNYINILQPVYFNVFLHSYLLQCITKNRPIFLNKEQKQKTKWIYLWSEQLNIFKFSLLNKHYDVQVDLTSFYWKLIKPKEFFKLLTWFCSLTKIAFVVQNTKWSEPILFIHIFIYAYLEKILKYITFFHIFKKLFNLNNSK